MVKCAYTIDDNGKEQGPFERYWDNGRLMCKCNYKDGKLNGPYREYDEAGRLSIWGLRVYKDGIQLNGKKAEDYNWEWVQANEMSARAERKGLSAKLAQIDKQMAPTQLRQAVKRAEISKFRSKFPNKKDGR